MSSTFDEITYQVLENVHLIQVKNYLVVFNKPIGLLINFGGLRLEFKKVYPSKPLS